MNGLRPLAIVVAIFVVASYLVIRERNLQKQHANGYRASGNAETASLYSDRVFALGDLFLTYDSTEQDSALWLVRPAETLRSWIWPGETPALEFKDLFRWDHPGRVVWSQTGNGTMDLLIELTPESNRQVSLVRVRCAAMSCGTTTQERGIPAGEKLVVGEDGSVLLIGNKNLDTYPFVVNLMGSTPSTTLRLTQAGPQEIAAVSREAALVISDPESFSGEVLQGPTHSRMTFTSDQLGVPVAMDMSGGLNILVDGERAAFWDCPASILNTDTECTVYTAPAGFPRSVPASIHDTECGIVITRGDSTWLVRRNAGTEDLLNVTGIVRCDSGELLAYRGRHIAYETVRRQRVNRDQRMLKVRLRP
jgi:hypothetical protein